MRYFKIFLFIVFYVCNGCGHGSTSYPNETKYSQGKIQRVENSLFVENSIITKKDSSFLESLNHLVVLDSEIKSDINSILSDSLINLEISYSSYIDTMMQISNLNRAKALYFFSNNFGVVIDDSLSVRKLSLTCNLTENNYSYIDASKLVKLESLFVQCDRCKVVLPKNPIKRLVIQTDEMDTSYIQSDSLPVPARLPKINKKSSSN
ncbi:hypothetical protein [Bernardetia sp.]|uniref:hypothetical protein n=1 Tax=Bernardetia sp. TaxID=1937974 RepID=UPI0025C565E9|nr:hypothetical protein [Bernardetia sp.]